MTILLLLEKRNVARGNTVILTSKLHFQRSFAPCSNDNRSKRLPLQVVYFPVKRPCLSSYMYLLTEWEGRTGNCLSRGPYVLTSSQMFSCPALCSQSLITIVMQLAFSRYSAPSYWLVHGHMTSNNETVHRQMPWAGNIAKTTTSTGSSALLPAKCWPLFHVRVVGGGLLLSLESRRVS